MGIISKREVLFMPALWQRILENRAVSQVLFSLPLEDPRAHTAMALGVELCYILKYVEMDAGSSSLVPWSIRQMVIYQKLDMNTQETTCIIIQPSADVRRRKDEVAESTKSCQDLSEHWTSLHSLLLGTLNRNWASYLKCLDIEVEKLVSIEFHSRVAEVLLSVLAYVISFSNSTKNWSCRYAEGFETRGPSVQVHPRLQTQYGSLSHAIKRIQETWSLRQRRLLLEI